MASRMPAADMPLFEKMVSMKSREETSILSTMNIEMRRSGGNSNFLISILIEIFYKNIDIMSCSEVIERASLYDELPQVSG